jgi:hypothetical protein
MLSMADLVEVPVGKPSRYVTVDSRATSLVDFDSINDHIYWYTWVYGK